jgi:hypothetical protein
MSETLEEKQARWKAHLEGVQGDLFNFTDILPPRLYHYSNLNAITNILKSREMWLTDVFHVTGDPRDGTYWLNVFRPIISRKSIPVVVKRFFGLERYGLGDVWHKYVVCFSPESELEYQWENYADHGKGCAIELSSEVLQSKSEGGKIYAYMPMLYARAEQEDKAEKTVDSVIELYRKEYMTPAEGRNYWSGRALGTFLDCGVRFKAPSFCEEREIRVFITRPDLDGVKHRPSPSGGPDIPYRTLSLTPDMVTGVIKGPCCTCSDDELKSLLKAEGFGEDVRTHVPPKAKGR